MGTYFLTRCLCAHGCAVVCICLLCWVWSAPNLDCHKECSAEALGAHILTLVLNICLAKCRIHGGDKQLEDLFVKESTEAGLLQLFGHPLLGGLRVCIYNGLPDEAISELLVFMSAFAKKHRH